MLAWQLLHSPWARNGSQSPHAPVGSRPVLLTDRTIDRVLIANQGLDLPSLGKRRLQGKEWSAFELSGTGRQSHGSEPLDLHLGVKRTTASIHLEEGLPGLPEADEEADREHRGMRVYGLIGRHTDLVYGPIEDQDRLLDGCASVDLGEFLDDWRKSDDTKDARLALIVRIATNIGATIQSIGNQPRLILRRKRAMERVGSVRQVDPAGIRWLVRQPGSSLAERAGPRQRVLAVVREDTVDTHENRVVRDMLDRCVTEGRVWLRDNDEFRSSDRYRDVAKLASTVRRIRGTGPLSTVRRATGAVEPNYVLQHDERYSRVWPWYVKLRRRQQEEDNLWRWSHRTFAEAVTLSLSWSLDLIEQEEEFPRGVGFARRLLLRPEQRHGAFVDPRSSLSSWLARDATGQLVALSLLTGSQVGSFERTMMDSTSLGDLHPDALVVAHDPFQPQSCTRALAVWSRLRFNGPAIAPTEFQDLAESLLDASGNVRIEGLIVEPTSERGSSAQIAEDRRVPTSGGAPVRVRVLSIPLRPDRARIKLQSLVKSSLLT